VTDSVPHYSLTNGMINYCSQWGRSSFTVAGRSTILLRFFSVVFFFVLGLAADGFGIGNWDRDGESKQLSPVRGLTRSD